jgi:hypothetical protein
MLANMPTAPALEYEFTLRATLGPQQVVGPGPYGLRIVVPLVGGTVSGPRINGDVVPSGADWLLIGNDGFGRVDVRAQFVTDDGATVYAYYKGVLELNAAAVTASGTPGAESSFDDQYFRTSPRFETGAEQYAWLHQSTFVGKGRMSGDGVEYEIYRVC